MRFWEDPSHHIETCMCIFCKEVYKQKWYQKRLLIVLQEFRNKYLQVSHQGYSTPTWHHEHDPQESWRSRWLQEKDAEQSALTHARCTHCTSRQLGTKANQRYDVPWDWLWDTCQLARVRWGTRCEGFCSKEGPHYRNEPSARTSLEHDQVQRALGELSRRCHKTSNYQPWFMGLEIPWGFLAQTVPCWLTWGLCHTRKWGLKIFVSKKSYDLRSPNRRLHEKPLRKGGMGEKIGTDSSTRFLWASCFKKMCDVCQNYGGTRKM